MEPHQEHILKECDFTEAEVERATYHLGWFLIQRGWEGSLKASSSHSQPDRIEWKRPEDQGVMFGWNAEDCDVDSVIRVLPILKNHAYGDLDGLRHRVRARPDGRTEVFSTGLTLGELGRSHQFVIGFAEHHGWTATVHAGLAETRWHYSAKIYFTVPEPIANTAYLVDALDVISQVHPKEYEYLIADIKRSWYPEGRDEPEADESDRELYATVWADRSVDPRIMVTHTEGRDTVNVVVGYEKVELSPEFFIPVLRHFGLST